MSVIGDSDLIIQQIKGHFLTNDPRLREYRGTVVEILNTFLQTQLAKIPRKQNFHVIVLQCLLALVNYHSNLIISSQLRLDTDQPYHTILRIGKCLQMTIRLTIS